MQREVLKQVIADQREYRPPKDFFGRDTDRNHEALCRRSNYHDPQRT